MEKQTGALAVRIPLTSMQKVSNVDYVACKSLPMAVLCGSVAEACHRIELGEVDGLKSCSQPPPPHSGVLRDKTWVPHAVCELVLFE